MPPGAWAAAISIQHFVNAEDGSWLAFAHEQTQRLRNRHLRSAHLRRLHLQCRHLRIVHRSGRRRPLPAKRRQVPGTGRRPAHLRPTGGPVQHPGRHPLSPGGHRPQRRRRPEPVPRALVQRPARWLHGRTGTRGAPTGADRRAGADHRGVRQPLPDDRCPQGPGRLLLPGSADPHRRVRPDVAPGYLAVHRQLRPGWRCHLAPHGLPGRRSATGEHEPGTLRVAGRVDRRP